MVRPNVDVHQIVAANNLYKLKFLPLYETARSGAPAKLASHELPACVRRWRDRHDVALRRQCRLRPLVRDAVPIPYAIRERQRLFRHGASCWLLRLQRPRPPDGTAVPHDGHSRRLHNVLGVLPRHSFTLGTGATNSRNILRVRLCGAFDYGSIARPYVRTPTNVGARPGVDCVVRAQLAPIFAEESQKLAPVPGRFVLMGRPTTRAALRKSLQLSPSVELRAWQMIFASGTDDGELKQAARDAWRRLGVLFMRDWKPDAARSRPWAFNLFGDPRRRPSTASVTLSLHE